jgi:hypothetical protein
MKKKTKIILFTTLGVLLVAYITLCIAFAPRHASDFRLVYEIKDNGETYSTMDYYVLENYSNGEYSYSVDSENYTAKIHRNVYYRECCHQVKYTYTTDYISKNTDFWGETLKALGLDDHEGTDAKGYIKVSSACTIVEVEE